MKKVKQKSLGKLAEELSVSHSSLSQVRHGKRPASDKVVSKLVSSGKQDLLDDNCSTRYNILGGPLAQLAEQLTLNQQVTGSIPVRLTIFEANFPHYFMVLLSATQYTRQFA